MILFFGMPRLAIVAHAVIAGTCDVSLRTESQSTLKVSQWAMLWEMSAVKACVRCVGVLALALGLVFGFMPHEAAGMYKNWRKRHSKLIFCPIPFSLILFLTFLSIILSFYLSPSPLTLSDYALSFNPLQAGLLDRNKRLMCLFMWLWTSQGKALAKEQQRTMEMAWSRHRAGLMRKLPSCKKSLQEISLHASVL